MNQIPEIKDIERVLLTGLVRQVLGSPTAAVADWAYAPIKYINTETSNLGLYRFQGTARDGGEARPWSMVLKAVHAPVNDTNPAYWNYHRREIFAYQEGLLADLPGGLLAPRCWGITEHPEELCWLWLEDLRDAASNPWSLSEYGLAAHHLGQFNGAYAAGHPLPTFPWLSEHWLRGWLNAYEATCLTVLDLIRTDDFREHPLLRSAFPRSIADDIGRLWSRHDTLLVTLDRLPRTFCHLDAYRPNLFLRDNDQGALQTVALDWVFAGIGGIGEEIANLLAASLIWFEYDATEARSLDEAVFTGYLDGLREAGWLGDYRLARLGYTAACALRWGVVGLWWLPSLGDADSEADLEKKWGRPLPELVAQWGQTTSYLLGLAEEAYALQQALF